MNVKASQMIGVVTLVAAASAPAVVMAQSAGGSVVYIASAPGRFAPPDDQPEISQRNMQFAPHVLPVLIGTTVKFSNHDNVAHNIFTPSAAGDLFNLGYWLKGQSKTHTFTKLGKIDLRCNVHSEMSGFVLVLQNPHFAITDKDGNFQINGVPPGNYNLKAWHEHGTAPATPVQISNGPVTVNFELAAHKRKS